MKIVFGKEESFNVQVLYENNRKPRGQERQ